MILIIGIVVICIVALLVFLYLKNNNFREQVKTNKKKIGAVAATVSVIGAGLAGLPDDINLSIDAELIDNLNIYEKYGYNISQIDNPVIYESEVLSNGHIPLVLNFDISEDIKLGSLSNAFLLRENKKFGFDNIDYKFKILQPYIREYIKTFYNHTGKFFEQESIIFNATSQKNETIIENVEIIIPYNKTIIENRYRWVDLKDIEYINLKKSDNIIIDIVGIFSAKTGKREIDIIPKISIGNHQKEFKQFAWWNSNWGYRKLITWNSSMITGSLTNFPALFNITDSDLQSHVAQCDGGDIAFIDYSDNTTQFNHEIEYYNCSSGELVAWVNDTDMSTVNVWIYYGNAGCADQWDIANTWDSNYIAVYHMNTTSDSTAYNNDGDDTGHATSINYSGIAHNCRYFDGTDEYIDITSMSGEWSWSNGTIEVWWNGSTDCYDSNLQKLIFNWYVNSNNNIGIKVDDRSIQNVFSMKYKGQNVAKEYLLGEAHYDTWKDKWIYAALVYNINADYVKYYLNNTLKDTKSSVTVGTGSVVYGEIGYISADPATEFNGTIDEVRVSDIARSYDWIGCTYNTTYYSYDGGFYSLGSEEAVEFETNFTLKGLTSGRITWNGENGNTVWCNSSGDAYETLEINLTVNASANITEVRIFMDDLNNSGSDITADNITLFMSVDNSTWRDFGTFPSGGGNISINDTTWIWADDPFNITSNMSLYARFKLSIPVGQTASTYYASSDTANKVYIGKYA